MVVKTYGTYMQAFELSEIANEQQYIINFILTIQIMTHCIIGHISTFRTIDHETSFQKVTASRWAFKQFMQTVLQSYLNCVHTPRHTWDLHQNICRVGRFDTQSDTSASQEVSPVLDKGLNDSRRLKPNSYSYPHNRWRSVPLRGGGGG